MNNTPAPAPANKRSWRSTLTGSLTLGLIALRIASDPINPASIIAHALDPTNLAAISLAVGQIVGADHAVVAGDSSSLASKIGTGATMLLPFLLLGSLIIK